MATWALFGSREAAAQAREHVREFLTAHGHVVAPSALRDSLLVVSELVTNAVMHAPGPSTLHLAHEHGVVVIAVSDSNPAPPRPRSPNPAAATGGFGWHLLTSLTTRIEIQPHADGGKIITAVLADHPGSPSSD